MSLQVHTVVVENPLRMKSLARHVSFGQLGPKPSCIDELRRGSMVGVSINPKRSKQPTRTGQPDHAGEFFAGLKRGFEATINQTQIASPAKLQNIRRSLRFGCANF